MEYSPIFSITLTIHLKPFELRGIRDSEQLPLLCRVEKLEKMRIQYMELILLLPRYNSSQKSQKALLKCKINKKQISK